MHNPCLIPKATDTHSEYVILISTVTLFTQMHLIVQLYVRLPVSSLNRKTLYIKDPHKDSTSSKGLLMPFTLSSWLATVTAMLLFIVGLALTWHLSSRQQRQQGEDEYGLNNSLFCMIGICCRQSKPQCPSV
jgi:ABC-type sulfate transport system permease component